MNGERLIQRNTFLDARRLVSSLDYSGFLLVSRIVFEHSSEFDVRTGMEFNPRLRYLVKCFAENWSKLGIKYYGRD